MSKGNLFIRMCLRAPRLSRLMLKTFCRIGGTIPERGNWINLRLRQLLCADVGILTVNIGDGLRLEIDLNSNLGQSIYFDGTCEPAITRFLMRTLRPGMVAIDGGANIGELSLRMAKYVGPAGTVIALEPSPFTFGALRRNIELNNLPNLHAQRIAIGGARSRRHFYLGKDTNSVASSLFPHNGAQTHMETAVISLTSLCEEQKLRNVDLIKLDIEGAELEALSGAADLLNQRNKPTLVVEYNHDVARRAGWQFSDLHRLLKHFGYRVFALENSGRLCKSEVSTNGLQDSLTKFDVVALA